MSMVTGALRNKETNAGGRRTVAEVVNSVATLEGESLPVRRLFAKRPRGRDPLEEARKRVHAQRKAEARTQTLAELSDAVQDDETALTEANS